MTMATRLSFKVLIICTLLLVNIANLYFDKFAALSGYTLAASPMELQLSP